MRPDARLAIPAATAWALLAVLIGFPVLLPWAVGAWLLAGVLALIAWRTRNHAGLLLGLVLGVVLSALFLSAATVSQEGRKPQILVEAAKAGLLVKATVVTTQAVHGHDRRFSATLHSGEAGGQEFGVAVPVLVFGSLGGETGIGTEVQLVGTLGEAEAGDHTAFLFFVDGGASVVRGPPWYLDWANSLRASFLVEATSLPGAGGRLLPGLAIGDTGAVDERLDAAMKASSLSHLTAVSGANCAVIIGLIMFGGAAVGLSRGWRIGASIVVLVGFVVLVTPEPSVLRAAVMATLVLAAMASGRQASGLPVLSLAVVGLLVFDPWLARNFGFVLSVCATAGLLLLAAPIARGLARWVPFPVAVLIAVPASAQFACQPVLILLAPSIPTYGVLANVLAGPAAPVATVLGLVACLFIPAVPLLGGLVAQVAWLPSAWIAAVAMFFAEAPGARLPWPSGGWGVFLVIVVSALGVVVWLLRGGAGAWLRPVASAALVLACVAYLGISGGEQLRRRLAPPGDWAIAACDVGQGDAVLVRSAGRVALIDTGAEPTALDYCLGTLGVGHIDLLVLTHFDLDHVGGVQTVIGRVERVMVGPSSGPHDDRIVLELVDAGATVEQVDRGLQGNLGELRWQVLWPPARLAGIEPGNDASVALEFSGVGECAEGCLSSLFLGDLGEESQSRMLAVNRLGDVDVVKVSHHGSRDQSSRLYERIRAAVGLIGVGADNDYGHPTDDILETLASTETVVGRTDLNGMVLVSMRAGVVHLWTERQGVAARE